MIVASARFQRYLSLSSSKISTSTSSSTTVTTTARCMSQLASIQQQRSSILENIKNKNLFFEHNFIDGHWTNSHTKRTLDVVDPATGEKFGVVPNSDHQDTQQAITAAHKAFAKWRKTSAAERGQILKKWADLMTNETNLQPLAQLLTIECGKPIKEAIGEIRYAASFFTWFGEEAPRVYGDIIPAPNLNHRIMVLKQPVGVVAAITPWNFPSAMLTRKVGAAFAAGCTVVAKPSEYTPYSALAMCELGRQAGVPAGVLNVLISADAAKVGEALMNSTTVRKITFTGSTAVGKTLIRQSAETVKRVSMELGGNAPFIVFEDADLDAAVAGIVASKFRNSGQTCVSANRIFVQDKVYDELARRLAKRVSELRVGHGLLDTTDQGPLINRAALHKVAGRVTHAVSQGARVLHGGNDSQSFSLPGYFYSPTVVTNVSVDSDLFHGEVFGPVAPLFKFTTEEECIALANKTTAGLAAYLYTQDYRRIWRMTEALEYGMIGVNEGIVSTSVAPFGGVKQSGLGREGSKFGVDEYLDIKYICLNTSQNK